MTSLITPRNGGRGSFAANAGGALLDAIMPEAQQISELVSPKFRELAEKYVVVSSS